jgi:regulator of protease activity HflC (stomatin/prohibitin superfamily)
VEEGQSGVLLRWGKILKKDGSAALEPGLKFSKWPYPAGEFVLFDDQNRPVNVGEAFWPNLKGRTLQTAIQEATTNDRLHPGRDGFVLTRGGDIAHIQLQAEYDIDDPEHFVSCVENVSSDPSRLDADTLVRLALQRAVVHVAAARSLQEFVDLSNGGKDELARAAQAMLDRVDSGIRISGVDTPVDPTPALAIKKAYGELQQAQVTASEAIERARQDAHNRLLGAAGYQYPSIVDLVAQYEDAFELGESERAETLLARINAQFESDEISGEVTQIIGMARSYRSIIESTLGEEARRFQGLLDAYRKNPALVAGRLWLEAYGDVLSRDDAEVIYAPSAGAPLEIMLAGPDHIRDARRKNRLDREERAARTAGVDLENPYIRRASEMPAAGKPGRQLTREGQGLGTGR